MIIDIISYRKAINNLSYKMPSSYQILYNITYQPFKNKLHIIMFIYRAHIMNCLNSV